MGLQLDNQFGAGSLRGVEYKVELLDMSRYCQWDNQGLECTAVAVEASAVPLVQNQWMIVVGTTVVCRAADSPTQRRDTAAQLRPYPSPSLSNGSHSRH